MLADTAWRDQPHCQAQSLQSPLALPLSLGGLKPLLGVVSVQAQY